MKFIFILILSSIFASPMILNAYGISRIAILKDFSMFASLNSSNISKKNGLSSSTSIENATLSKIDSNKMKGLLIVKIAVNNKNVGNKSPSDFIINIHANDPSVVSFNGNPSGTNVKLGMGMYGVSEHPIPGYIITSYSADCFGGMMSIYVKYCITTNTYYPPITSSIAK